MKSFNVIWFDFTSKKFKPYDVIPYLIDQYKEIVSKEDGDYYVVPKSKEEFEEFVKKESMYMWWARCEYEIILHNWPCNTVSEKWDVHKQIMMNVDIITEIIMQEVKNL